MNTSKMLIWKTAKRGWGAQAWGLTRYGKTRGIAARKLSKAVTEAKREWRNLEARARYAEKHAA